jgi:hypothetical protein
MGRARVVDVRVVSASRGCPPGAPMLGEIRNFYLGRGYRWMGGNDIELGAMPYRP